MTKQMIAASILTSVLACSLLFWPLLGSPPYSFFAVLKIVVFTASLFAAWSAWNLNKLFAPLSLLLVASAYVHMFEKMRRAEWALFNWAAILLFCIYCILAVFSIQKDRDCANSPAP